MQHNHKQAVIALKKAQTHIKKVIEMIEADEYCIDVITQIMAVKGQLGLAADKILGEHMQSCFVSGMHSEDDEHKQKMVKEIIAVYKLAQKG